MFKKLNIFTTYDHCYFINFQCKQDCFCENKEGNIHKICFNNDIFLHETNIYLNLLSYNADLTTMISTINKQVIVYHIKNFISLRQYMITMTNTIKDKSHIPILLNEVFSFIHSFKKYNFIHGNPHIDNIYVKIKNTNQLDFEKFYIIDLSNSYFNKLQDTTYKRTSFLEEYDKKNHILKHWDFLCIFTSLKIYFENNIHLLNHISYIQSIIVKYIGHDTFTDLIHQYQQIIDYEHYNNIKKKYKSI